jgi:meso-butanediol dehydrogenase/(S,S)-butanediol dehydrogenase/diacetyl reductase
VSLPQQAAYTASKGAVAALTRSVAIDWAAHGVRVNAVAPGLTVTPMTEAFFENETFTQAATRRIPIGRLLLADEIAGAVVFLATRSRARSRAWFCPSTAAGQPASRPCPGSHPG